MSSSALSTRLPSLFLVGFPKAGTTTLHNVLVSAGAVGASVKEPSVLLVERRSSIGSDDQLSELATAYRHYYPSEADGPRIDASPYYIYDEPAIARLAALGSATHLLVTVRDPWMRLKSAYLDQAMQGYERRSLQGALDGELASSTEIRRTSSREFGRCYVTSSCFGEYIDRLLVSPVGHLVRLIALENFGEPGVVADLADWTELNVAQDWNRANRARTTQSAAPALVHGIAQQVSAKLPPGLHSRLAPLAKPAMAKLASVPLPARRGPEPDTEVTEATELEVRQRLSESMARLRAVPNDYWIGDPPSWLNRYTG